MGAYLLGASAALYFSHVRNAQLGLVICTLVLLLLHKRTGLALGLLATLCLAVVFSATLQDRFADVVMFFESGIYSSDRRMLGSGRWALWTVSMTEYLKYPVGDIFLGLGLGKHRILTEPLYSAHYYDPEIGYIDPHNDYLSLMYQMGPTALVCYVIFQFLVMWAGLKLGRIGRTAWAREFGLFMVALSCTVFLTNFLSNAFVSRVTLGWYYWGMAGLLFGEFLETRGALRDTSDQLAQAELAEFKAQAKGRVRGPGVLAQPGMRARKSLWPFKGGRRYRGSGRRRR